MFDISTGVVGLDKKIYFYSQHKVSNVLCFTNRCECRVPKVKITGTLLRNKLPCLVLNYFVNLLELELWIQNCIPILDALPHFWWELGVECDFNSDSI